MTLSVSKLHHADFRRRSGALLDNLNHTTQILTIDEKSELMPTDLHRLQDYLQIDRLIQIYVPHIYPKSAFLIILMAAPEGPQPNEKKKMNPQISLITQRK